MSIDDLIFSAASNPSTTSLRPEDAQVSGAAAAEQKLADEFDEFMLLLTTQLQNQDPTEPLDTNQFTQQLVQFTGVEQSVEVNKNLERLIDLNSSQQTDSAVSYIGKYVETSGNSGFLSDGQASFSYDIPAGAQTASITVLDSVGRPVHTQTVEATPGEYTYGWDGVSSFDGTTLPDGTYSFGLAVRDINGNTLDATTYTSGVVTAVSLDTDTPVMTLNGVLEVDADNISSVVGFFE